MASDHIAETLLLSSECFGLGAEAAAGSSVAAAAAAAEPPKFDAVTKACSFRPQAALTSFFALKPKAEGPVGPEAGASDGESSSASKKQRL